MGTIAATKLHPVPGTGNRNDLAGYINNPPGVRMIL